MKRERQLQNDGNRENTIYPVYVYMNTADTGDMRWILLFLLFSQVGQEMCVM